MGNLYEQTNTLLYISELVLLENDEERKQNLNLTRSEKLDKLKDLPPGFSSIDDYPKAEPDSTKKSRKNGGK